MNYNRILAIALSVLMVACSNMQHMNDISYRTIKDNFKLGDKVVIVDRHGKQHNLKISRITADEVYGYDHDKEVSFSYSQISEIQYREFSGGKTAGAGAAVVAILVLIAAAMLVAADDMFESQR